jgi:hypothetical protein
MWVCRHYAEFPSEFGVKIIDLAMAGLSSSLAASTYLSAQASGQDLC